MLSIVLAAGSLGSTTAFAAEAVVEAEEAAGVTAEAVYEETAQGEEEAPAQETTEESIDEPSARTDETTVQVQEYTEAAADEQAVQTTETAAQAKDAEAEAATAEPSVIEEAIKVSGESNGEKTTEFVGYGVCGDNLEWSLTSEGLLQIFGSGYKIDECAFQDFDKVKSVTFSENVTVIGNSAFEGCINMVNLELPEKLTTISPGAFYRCSSLVSLEIPHTVNRIGWNAFSDCTSLMNVKLPVGLQGISEGLFYNCSSLKNIDIPGSVTYVVEGAFNKCDGLTDVFYSGTRAQWDAISIASYNDPLKNAAIHCVDAVKNIEDLDITIEDAVFNGGAVKPEITIKDGDTVLTEGTDYVVTYECNTNAGVGIAVISGTGAYTGTDAESFKILPKPITPVIELSNTTFVYNRSAQKPEVTVKDGETVISDLDYVVTWPSSSIAVGQYKISVQMKNN